MKITTTLFLGVLLTGVGVYYFVWEKPISFKSQAEASPVRVLALAQGDIPSWLMVQNQATKEMISLKREGGDWWLEFPVSYPAENLLVEGMISALTYSNRVRRLSMENLEKQEYGFDSPKIKIGIATAKEPRPRYLLFGGASPVNRGVYAWWEGEKEYFLIPPELKASFERTVYSLRKKKIFRSNMKETVWIHMKSGPQEYRLEKKEGKWFWTLPALAGEIPEDKVSELLSSFETLYVNEFMDGQNLDDAKFGLQPRDIFLAAGTKPDQGEKLILGNLAGGKEALYSLRENENVVLLVSAEHLKALLQRFELTFQEMRV